MIQHLSEKITKKMIQNRIIKASEKEIYDYCFEATIVWILSYFILISVSLIFNELWSALIFIIAFSIFRKICGGYHAKNYTKCGIMSLSSLLVLLFIIKKIPILFVYINYINFISLVFIFLFSPIQNKNKPLTKKQHRIFKTLSRSTAIILVVIMAVLEFRGCHQITDNKYYFSFSYGIGLEAFSLLISVFERRVIHDKG